MFFNLVLINCELFSLLLIALVEGMELWKIEEEGRDKYYDFSRGVMAEGLNCPFLTQRSWIQILAILVLRELKKYKLLLL